MGLILAACLPVFLGWTVGWLWGQVRWPSHRGAVRRRRASKASLTLAGGMRVSVSRRAAARATAIRVNGVVRAGLFVALVVVVVTSGSWFVVIPAALVFAWAMGKMDWLALAVFAPVAEGFTHAFTPSTMRYQYTSYRQNRANRTHLVRGVSVVVVVVGLGLISWAGSAAVFGNDALVLPWFGAVVRHTGVPPLALAVLYSILGWGVALLGVQLERASRRAEMHRVAVPGGRLHGPDEKYTVLLRSFGSEARTVYGRVWPRGNALASLIPRTSHFFEDVIGWQCWHAGPVIAVADPRRRAVSTAGATHRFVPEGQEWQAYVDSLLAGASLVLVIDGESPGLRWEVERILGDVELLGRTLFLRAPGLAEGQFFRDLGVRPPGSLVQPAGAREEVLAAMKDGESWTWLSSAAAEDVDYEECVEWALLRTGSVPSFDAAMAVSPRPRNGPASTR